MISPSEEAVKACRKKALLDWAAPRLLELPEFHSEKQEEETTINRRMSALESAIERARAALPVVQNKVYMNTGWSGPSPRPVIDEMMRVLERLSSDGVSHHNYKQMRKNIERLRSRLATFLGAHPQEIAFTRGTTEAINIVVAGIEWRPGQKIVTTNIEHGAALIPVYNLRDRYKVDIEIVDVANSRDPVQSIARAIDVKTRLVVASHVSFNTGLRLPLERLSAAVAQKGAELLVDGAQSVGAFQIDLGGSGCDYYAFPGHKWMLGPDAVGALYVRREKLSRLKLTFAGNESAKKYDRNGYVSYQRSARKFEYADFNAALVAGWLKALEFLETVGMENIEAAIAANADYLKRRLKRLRRVSVITPLNREKSAGLVSIAIDGRDSPRVFEELLALGFVARYTPPPSYIRFSVNYFNTISELDRLTETLKKLTGS